MEVTLNALDTLFFRDGKPFARGDETWADSNFPPNPSVIYGAMRTALATIEGREIPFKNIPTELKEDKFAVQGLYYRVGNSSYLPLPLDYVQYRSDEGKHKSGETIDVHRLEISFCKSVLSTKKSFLKYLLHPKGFQQAEGLDGGLISETELKKYLLGGAETTQAHKMGDFLNTEPKIGIGRDNETRVAEEGLLYRVDMKRPNGIEMRVVSMANGYTAAELNKTIANLGGEMKLIHLQSVAERNELTIQKNTPTLHQGRFKIYLSTPAIFTRLGWQPDLERFGIKATLVAACVGKPQSIGGYDIQKNEPKPMLRAVPAGSVFYYETEEESSKIAALHGESLSDVISEQGFGIAFLGNFNTPISK